MVSMESVVPLAAGRRSHRARHALGPLALVMAVVAVVLTIVGVVTVGAAAGELQAVYGQPITSIPGSQLPQSVSVYVGVGLLGLALAAVALVCGLVAFLRYRCRVAGALAVLVCLFLPASAIIAYALTAQPS